MILVIEIIYMINSEILSNKDRTSTGADKERLKKYAFFLLFLLYTIFIMVEQSFTDVRMIELLPIDLVFLMKVYRRLKKLHLLLKIRIPASWRNQIQIF